MANLALARATTRRHHRGRKNVQSTGRKWKLILKSWRERPREEEELLVRWRSEREYILPTRLDTGHIITILTAVFSASYLGPRGPLYRL